MKYDTLIVPGLETIRSSTLKRLTDFKNRGGNLIFLGECPTLIDAVPSDEVKKLYRRSTVIPFERYALLTALEKDRELEIRTADGALANNYVHQMRDDGDCRWLFIANAIYQKTADIANAKKLFIKIKGKFAPRLYDTVSGEIKDVSYSVKYGWTHIEYTAFIHDSILLRLESTSEKELTLPSVTQTVISRTDYFRDKVAYRRDEPNVLLLDIAEYKLDNEKDFAPAEEILRLDAIVRERAKIPPKDRKQPWVIKPEPATHTVTLRFTFNSEIDVKGAKLAIESPLECTIRLDGKKISNEPDGYFTDESIETVPLKNRITKGSHELIITMPLGTRTYTEWCYIIGEFNVRLEGTEKTIVEATDLIGFGSVTSQGMPFYGGNVKYYCDFEVPEDGDTVRIHANYYRGALISVKIDGKDAGKIVYAPYNLTVDGLTKGSHTAELTLYGNRYNCFAPLHCANRENSWVGPGTWSTKHDSFCYEPQIKEMGILASPVIEILK